MHKKNICTINVFFSGCDNSTIFFNLFADISNQDENAMSIEQKTSIKHSDQESCEEREIVHVSPEGSKLPPNKKVQATMTDIKLFKRSLENAATSTADLLETIMKMEHYLEYETYLNYVAKRQKKIDFDDVFVCIEGETDDEFDTSDEEPDCLVRDWWIYSPYFEMWTNDWVSYDAIGIAADPAGCRDYSKIDKIFSFARLKGIYGLLEAYQDTQ